MPFLRYARDKRGYEHVYLVQPTAGRKGKVRARILYWYRTPPNVKVGREPFDEDVRRSIEKQYPDLQFDWPKLLATPKPAVVNTDIERWRERRRQVKAERAAAAAEAKAEADEAEPADLSSSSEFTPRTKTIVAAAETAAPAADGNAEAPRKRRRRRRRGRRPDRPGETVATPKAEATGESLEPTADSDEPSESDEVEPESE